MCGVKPVITVLQGGVPVQPKDAAASHAQRTFLHSRSSDRHSLTLQNSELNRQEPAVFGNMRNIFMHSQPIQMQQISDKNGSSQAKHLSYLHWPEK